MKKYRKYFLVVLVMVMSITLFGCGSDDDDSDKDSSDDKAENSEKDDDSSVDLSIEDAMTKGDSLYCKNSNTEVFIDGKKVHAIVKAEGAESHTLSLSDMLYVWDAKTKTGTKMASMDEEDFMDEDYIDNLLSIDADGDGEDDETIEDVEVDELKCSTKDIDDSEFKVPSDVTFTDMNNLMEDMDKMMEQLNM